MYKFRYLVEPHTVIGGLAGEESVGIRFPVGLTQSCRLESKPTGNRERSSVDLFEIYIFRLCAGGWKVDQVHQ